MWLIGTENRVSTFILFYGILFLYLKYKYDRKIKFDIAVLTWIICVLSFGRSGIVSSTLLLLGTAYNKSKRDKCRYNNG